MRRWIFRCLNLASVAVCITSSTLWILSYFRTLEFWALRRDETAGEQFIASATPSRDGVKFAIDVREPAFDSPNTRDLGTFWFVSRYEATPYPSVNSKEPYFWPKEIGEITRHGAERFGLGAARELILRRNAPFLQGKFKILDDHTTVILPLAAIVIPAAVLPIKTFAILLRSRRRGARSRNLVCIRCGYDLRATPELCPECGLQAGSA